MVKNTTIINKVERRKQALGIALLRSGDTPGTTSLFIKDALLGMEKEWLLYKRAVSAIALNTLKGRPEPLRSGGSCSGSRTNTWHYITLLKEKEGLTGPGWTGWLPLHTCRDDKARVNMILACDAPSSIKADLLSAVFNMSGVTPLQEVSR